MNKATVLHLIHTLTNKYLKGYIVKYSLNNRMRCNGRARVNKKIAEIQINYRFIDNPNASKDRLILTILHEIAHILTFEYKGKRQHHNWRWRKQFANLLIDYDKNT